MDDLDLELGLHETAAPAAAASPAPTPARDPLRMLRRIPVRLSVEVGGVTLPLSELMALQRDSVLELDRLAGEPLLIKVNGTQIGRGEVVVSGDNYGLKIVELDELDTLAP